jgi:hypothetical protein
MNNAQLNNPELKKAIKDFCSEMSSSMARAEAEREYQREAVKIFHEEHEVDKKLLRKMAKAYHKQNFQTTVAEQEEFEITYSKVFEVDKTL